MRFQGLRALLCALAMVLIAVPASATELPAGKMFVTGSVSDNIVVFDLESGQSRPFGGGSGDEEREEELDGPMSIEGETKTPGDTSLRRLICVNGLGSTIELFDDSGAVIDTFKTPAHPSGVVLTPSGTMLVTMFGNLDMKTFVNEEPDHRVMEFTSDGRHIRTITHPDLRGPSGITRGPDGTIWVVASNTAEQGGAGQGVFHFDLEGNYLGRITSESLDGPLGVAVNSSGNVLVTSFFTNSVVEFSPDGDVVRTIKARGLTGPTYLKLDSRDNIYVSSLFTDSIVVFDAAGKQLKTFSSPDLDGPYGIKIFER